jgi:alpha-mannosidase
MHDDRALIERRLRRALRRIEEAVYRGAEPVELGRWDVPGEPVPVSDALAATYAPAQVGDRWGPPWGTTWFRVRGRVPAGYADGPVELRLDLGFTGAAAGFQAEGLVYRRNGTPVKAINPRTPWVRITDSPFDLYVEAAANPTVLDDFRPTPIGDVQTAGRAPLYRLARAELAVFDEQVWQLKQDLDVLGQLAGELDSSDARKWEILRVVDRALDRVDMADIAATAPAARATLAEALSAPARASAHRISAVGHAHIDSAWLWPVRETVRKVARTACNVVSLMADHPELVYAMSSAQQCAWLKEHRPEVWTEVAKRVGEGRFVPVGGMWVESDTNMPGGEALARQFSHGKRFLLEEFGVETHEVWLPDSFGYSAALPQLVALSGSRWFLTQKISWNATNRFPHHTFKWEGIDGTQVFTHFPPADTYNSEISGAELAHAARNFAEKGVTSRSLLPFGWGDGGGGPTREMLARAARLRDVDGSPRVEIESPAAFFTKAEAEYPNPPVWVGELYLELHRGTYTSQARTKQGNRRCEHLLREAELWCATAAVRAGADYPYVALDRLWKLVLLQQFHDILPGSSIRWVHREAEANYAAAAAELEELTGFALRVLAGPGARETTFNATPHAHAGVTALGGGAAVHEGRCDVRPVGDGFVLDNGWLRVRIDARGLLTSVHDLGADREVLAPGSVGNLLQLHPDTPAQWDAWDVDSYYRNVVTDLTEAESVVAVEQGVQVRRTFGRSSVVQTITLASGAGRVDVDCEIDWHESERLLKVAFDLDVAADRSAAEIQFGHVFRPAHANTSWDAARFEICAHRWLHVAEQGYGVAVVNDSTYGHDVTRAQRVGGGTTTRVRLSLLRAPRSPDPDADQGAHRLRYALVPGAGIDDAVREGYLVNLPLRTVPGSGAEVPPVISVDGAVVESVKLADDGSGDVVVRFYEALGGRRRAVVRTDFAHTSPYPVDLLERQLYSPVPDADGTLELRPFQIVTLRFPRERS